MFLPLKTRVLLAGLQIATLLHCTNLCLRVSPIRIACVICPPFIEDSVMRDRTPLAINTNAQHLTDYRNAAALMGEAG